MSRSFLGPVTQRSGVELVARVTQSPLQIHQKAGNRWTGQSISLECASTRAQNELGRIREMTRNMRDRDGGTLNETDRTYIQDRLDHLGNDIHWMAHNGW